MNTVIVDLIPRRNARDARLYQLCQAAALLKLFKRSNGRDATSYAELDDFVAAAGLAGQIDPFAILSDDEIESATRD